MIRKLLCATVVALVPAAGWSDGYFGTREEAKQLADEMITIVDSEGIEMAIKAMHDPQRPFVGSRMGVNLFEGSTVIADNREPETIAAEMVSLRHAGGVRLQVPLEAGRHDERDGDGVPVSGAPDPGWL